MKAKLPSRKKIVMTHLKEKFDKGMVAIENDLSKSHWGASYGRKTKPKTKRKQASSLKYLFRK